MGQIQRYPIWIYDVAVTFKPGLSFNWHCQWITCLCKRRARSIHISQIVSKEHAFASEIFGQLRSSTCVFCTLYDKVKISHTCNEIRSATEWIAHDRSVRRVAKPENAKLTLYYQDGQSIYFKIDHWKKVSPLKFWFKDREYVLCGFHNHSAACVYALVQFDIDGEILLRVSRANQTCKYWAKSFCFLKHE